MNDGVTTTTSNKTITVNATTTATSCLTDPSLLYVPTTYSISPDFINSDLVDSLVYGAARLTQDTYSCSFGKKEREIGVNKVKIIENKEGVAKGVIVTFEDGDEQKSICNEEDVFQLDIGFMICVAKHALKLLGSKNPTKTLSKAVTSIFRKYDEQVIKELEEEEKKKTIEYRRAKRAEKKKRREERKANAEKERQIEIQKEAIVRAMNELNMKA